MERKKKRWIDNLFQLENEILIPFLLIGIVVILSFSAISYYNGYTIKMDNEENSAAQLLKEINWDIDYLNSLLGKQAVKDKYQAYSNRHIAITDQEGKPVNQVVHDPGKDLRVLSVSDSNQLNWKIQYLINSRTFLEELLEEQTYVVIGAIAALLIIIQASIFIAYSISSPIRSMSETCKEIDKNKGDYRKYQFSSIKRRDEIGQLATTFESLLKNMDNYTKIEYTNRMASTLAHEIKNPITGIRSGIQVLKGRVEKPGDKMLCDSMMKEIDRVTTLITNLFTLSVKRESMKENFEVEAVLAQITSLYSRPSEHQSVTLDYCVEPGLLCYANENEVRQILHNLISNSIRAMSPSLPGSIQIRAYGSGKHTVLVLRDNGKGMTREELEQAMEPFYTKSVNGIGLGLAIVKKLMEQNDGVMEMESEPGQGTCVTLTFNKGE